MDNLELRPLAHDSGRPGSAISGTSKGSNWTLETDRAPFVETAYDPGKADIHIGHKTGNIGQPGSYNWLPATLRMPYLISLFLISTILGIVVLFLTLYSTTNYGLGTDNGSSALLFGWRFSPTLFAVVYSILTATLLNDVRRTEIFVRLSRDDGAASSSTLLLPSRFWWNDPVDALSQRKNGSRSWALFLASFVNIMGFLIISPLSAGLLAPVDIDIPKTGSFGQLDTVSNIPFQSDFSDQMMFQTISGAILNRSTSAWISTDYFVLPFWPTNYGNAPLAANIPVSQVPQQWTGKTTAYKATLDCVDVSLKSQRNNTASDLGLATRGNRTEDYNGTLIEFSSNDGCSINLFTPVGYSSDITWLGIGGGWWADSISHVNQSLLNTPNTGQAGSAIINTTGNCDDRSWISYNMPWTSNQTFEIKGHICKTQYLEANISATVTMNSTALVSFDPVEFAKNGKPMDPAKYNLPQLQDSFFNSNWSTKFPAPNQYSIHPVVLPFGGPLQAIAAGIEYNNSPQKLLDSLTIVNESRQLQQEWFGQMLLSSLSIERRPAAATIQGQTKVKERRIVAVMGIGITIGVLFLISSVCLIAIVYFTRLDQRPLNLQSDPGSIAVASSLIASDAPTRATFEGVDSLSKEALRQRLCRGKYSLHEGNLVAEMPQLVLRSTFESDHSADKQLEPNAKDNRPVVLRGWMGPLLFAALLALVGAIVVLYKVSTHGGLHQQALVHEFDFAIADTVTRFAPYSVIPTLIAVGVKLWYGAIEENFRRLQPFLAMAVKPAPVSQSLLVEYTNAPLAFMSAKAAKNSHYMLALVGLGALGTEIFTVGISAIWDRRSEVIIHTLNGVGRQLELRNVPVVYESAHSSGAGTHQDPITPFVLSTAYGNYLTSWLYGATNEMAQNADSPPWSNDTWSFVPLDFTDVTKDLLSLSPNATSSDLSLLPYNITVTTQALRARLECTAIDYIANTSLWLLKWDFNNKTLDTKTNRTLWNATNRPPNLDLGYELLPSISSPPHSLPLVSIPILGALGYPTCCSNETNGIPGEAAIGYWNQNLSSTSIVAKWIVGKPLEKLYGDSTFTGQQGDSVIVGSHWIWEDQPKMQAISCVPKIEQANASVTVDLRTGAVQNYTILDTPVNATGAFTDNFLQHSRSKDYAGPNVTAYGAINVTTSYGYVFLDALLGASSVQNLGSEFQFSTNVQNVKDHAFNFRIRGLNVDFMSYSMLALVNNDKSALLDAQTLIDKANTAFGIYFKHYASDNVTTANGGLAFQPIGDKLPSTLGASLTVGQGYNDSQAVNVAKTTQIVVHVPVDMLVMSKIAVFLCLAVLAFLSITTIIIYAFYSNRFKVLPRDVDTLASVLGFVYGSERLLEWVRERKESGNWKDNGIGGQLMARLGPFETAGGEKRWGVEIVEEGDERNVR